MPQINTLPTSAHSQSAPQPLAHRMAEGSCPTANASRKLSTQHLGGCIVHQHRNQAGETQEVIKHPLDYLTLIHVELHAGVFLT